MSNRHLIDNIFIICCSLIIHTPTTIYELKSSFTHQNLDLSLPFFCLFIPPPIEKGYLDINKFLWWVINEIINDTVKNILNSRECDSRWKRKLPKKLNFLAPLYFVYPRSNTRLGFFSTRHHHGCELWRE